MNKEKLNLTETRATNLDFKKFEEYFPYCEIMDVKESDIPDTAMDIFEIKSRQCINSDKYRPRNFKKYFVINHESGDSTYIAQQIKTYCTNKNTEELTYFVDIRGDKLLGYSELRNNISNPIEYYKDKPFVGYTKTEEEFRKQGLGSRRLLMMEAFSEMQYGPPLNSDTLNREKNIWEKLISEGKAEKYMEGKNIRYRFISKPKNAQGGGNGRKLRK